MIRTIVQGWVVVMAMGAVVVAAEGRPRLAGIVDVGDGRRMAVIELDDGSQRIVRAGNHLRQMEVLEVGAEWVRLRSPDGELRLDFAWKNKGGGVEQKGGESDSGTTAVAAPAPAPVHGRTISQRLIDGLRELEEDASAGADDIELRLTELLEFPFGSQVVAVDDEPVTSPHGAVTALRFAVDQGRAPRLSVRRGTVVETIYLIPPEKGK